MTDKIDTVLNITIIAGIVLVFMYFIGIFKFGKDIATGVKDVFKGQIGAHRKIAKKAEDCAKGDIYTKFVNKDTRCINFSVTDKNGKQYMDQDAKDGCVNAKFHVCVPEGGHVRAKGTTHLCGKKLKTTTLPYKLLVDQSKVKSQQEISVRHNDCDTYAKFYIDPYPYWGTGEHKAPEITDHKYNPLDFKQNDENKIKGIRDIFDDEGIGAHRKIAKTIHNCTKGNEKTNRESDYYARFKNPHSRCIRFKVTDKDGNTYLGQDANNSCTNTRFHVCVPSDGFVTLKGTTHCGGRKLRTTRMPAKLLENEPKIYTGEYINVRHNCSDSYGKVYLSNRDAYWGA